MAAPKFFNISSYSFKPPALPDRDATTVRPDWVLLDTKAYISDLTNGTTATASASNGVPAGVTFWVADLPALSHFSGNCEALSDFAEEPRVICSDKNVAILCLYWLSTKSARYRVLYDYFVYTARSPKNAAPSLIRLPNPRPRRVFSPLDMGILPTADGEGFVIAVVCPQQMFPGLYYLHTFLSKDWRWNTRSALLEPQSVAGRTNVKNHKTDKVIPLTEEGSLGWVDCWRGILLCNVLDVDNPNPVVRYIPLPKPMAGNMDIENCPWLYRDVAYIGGRIKFVELEVTVISPPKKDQWTGGLSDHIPDMLFDSDLELDDDNTCVVEDKAEDTVRWRAVAWVRETSQKCWIKDCEAGIDDIAIDNNAAHSNSLPPLKNLMTAAPTLSMCGDDIVVYLMCKLKMNGDNAWVIAINMTRKTLEDMTLFSAKRTFFFNTTYRPCSLSKHLDMAADNREVGVQIKEEDDSESRTVLIDRLDPRVTEDELRCIFGKSGELGDVQILADQQRASVKFVHMCSAGNAIREFNGFLIGRNHIRVSWKCNTLNGQQTGDAKFSGASRCDHTAEGTFRYPKRSRLEAHVYHLQQLKLLPLPFRSTEGR
jgi:hypothetical protein